METKVQEMSIIESLLENIKHTSNRLDSLADRLDVKLNGEHPLKEESSQVGGVGVGIIGKLQDIKKLLSNTEKSLEEQISKM